MPLRTLRSPAVLFTVSLVLLSACNFVGGQTTVEGSGAAASETREVADFRSVSFALPVTLFLEQADAPTLRIEGDDNLLPHVVARVRNGELRIGPGENTRLRPQTPLRVVVSAPELETIRNAGSGSVEAPNLGAAELSLTLAGSGDAHLPNLQAEVLRVQVAGSGGVEITGRVRRQVLSLAGSAGVEARELESDSLDVNIAGSGSATVRVRERSGGTWIVTAVRKNPTEPRRTIPTRLHFLSRQTVALPARSL
jgi:hypothetical protein